jgi:hypothetical protein
MKRFILTMFTISYLCFCGAAIIDLTACTPTTTTPAQLAPGYNNQVDQTMGEVLSGARAFYVSVQQQAQSGTLTMTPQVKAAFNTFAATLNGADAAYLVYHQNPTAANLAAAQNAVNAVQTQQAALPLPGAK